MGNGKSRRMVGMTARTVNVDFGGSRGRTVHAFKGRGVPEDLQPGETVLAKDDDGTVHLCKVVDEKSSHFLLLMVGV